jgi:hypothetical protein
MADKLRHHITGCGRGRGCAAVFMTRCLAAASSSKVFVERMFFNG